MPPAPPPMLQGRLGVILFTVAVLTIGAALHPLLQVSKIHNITAWQRPYWPPGGVVLPWHAGYWSPRISLFSMSQTNDLLSLHLLQYARRHGLMGFHETTPHEFKVGACSRASGR